ncbi:9801_t:CDS:1, partial [Gigaspora margarita]
WADENSYRVILFQVFGSGCTYYLTNFTSSQKESVQLPSQKASITLSSSIILLQQAAEISLWIN